MFQNINSKYQEEENTQPRKIDFRKLLKINDIPYVSTTSETVTKESLSKYSIDQYDSDLWTQR